MIKSFSSDIFITVSYRKDGEIGTVHRVPLEKCFGHFGGKHSENDFFGTCFELAKLILRLRYFTGFNVYLCIDNAPGLFADRIIISSTIIEDDVEQIDSVTCPLGNFAVLAFERTENEAESEQMITVDEKLKQYLHLLPCEIEQDLNRCNVTYVAKNPHITFPPLRPENYFFGTAARIAAEDYWQHHQENDSDDEILNIDVDEHGCPIFANFQNALDAISTLIEDGLLEPGEYDIAIEPQIKDYVIATSS